MQTRRSRTRLAIATILLLAVLAPGCATAPDARDGKMSLQKGDAAVAQLVGAWQFVSQEGRNIESGELIASATAQGLPGILIYSTDGWMMVSIDRRSTGGAYWGYFGKFSVEGGKLVHTIEGGSISARGPSPANYRLENEGRRLVISTLPSTNNVVVHYTFERVS